MMERTVLLNKKGVTLIEMMIALAILLIASLALMQTALLGISMNVQNSLRDEAVNVAEKRMSELMGLPFTYTATDAHLNPTPPTTPDPETGIEETGVPRAFRGFDITFTPFRRIIDINPDTKQITIRVEWSYKNKNYSHGVTTIMRKQ